MYKKKWKESKEIYLRKLTNNNNNEKMGNITKQFEINKKKSGRNYSKRLEWFCADKNYRNNL